MAPPDHTAQILQDPANPMIAGATGDLSRAEDGMPQPRRFWAVVAISFGVALFVVDGGIANVALPTIARAMGVDNGAVTNVITVYQLVMVMGLLPLAKLGDRIGHRRLYMMGLLLFVLCSAMVLFIDSFAMLLLMRVGQALGASMGLSVSAAMLRTIYPANKLGSGLGFNSVVVAASASIAPTLGGYIVANLSWEYVFFAAVPLGLISLLMARTLPDPVRHDRPSEWLSGGWIALTVLLLVGGMQISTHATSHWPGALVALTGVISAMWLVRRERSRAHPVLPVDLLARPVLGFSVLAGLACFMAVAVLMISLPFRFEEGLGFTPDMVGLLMLPFPLTLVFVSPVSGMLSDKIAPTKLGVSGMIVAITGLVLLALLPNSVQPFDIAWRLSLCALGFGLFIAPNSRIVIGMAPADRAAAAGSMLSTTRMLGQTVASATVGLLLASGLGQGPVPMLLACGLCVLAALSSLARFFTVRRHGID